MALVNRLMSYERELLIAPIAGFLVCAAWATVDNQGSGISEGNFVLPMVGAFAALVCSLLAEVYRSAGREG